MKLLTNQEVKKSHIYTLRIIYLIIFAAAIFFTNYAIKAFAINTLFLIPLVILLLNKKSYQSNKELITCSNTSWLAMIFGSQIALYLIVIGICGMSQHLALPPYTHAAPLSINSIISIPLFPWSYTAAMVGIFLVYLSQANTGSIFNLFTPQIKSVGLRSIFSFPISGRNEVAIALFAMLAILFFGLNLAGIGFDITRSIYILLPIGVVYYLLVTKERLQNFLYKNRKQMGLPQQIIFIVFAASIIFMLVEAAMHLSNIQLFNQGYWFNKYLNYVNTTSNKDAWHLLTMGSLLMTSCYLSIFYIRISQGRKIISATTAILILPVLIYLSYKFLHINYQMLVINNLLVNCLLVIIGFVTITFITMQVKYRQNLMHPIQINTQVEAKKRSVYVVLGLLCKRYAIALTTIFLFGFGLSSLLYAMMGLYLMLSLPILIWLAFKAFGK